MIIGDTTKLSMYNSGTRIDTFTESKDSKKVKLNSAQSIIGATIIDVFQTDNLWQTFLYSIPARIKTVKLEEKDCYVIKNYLSPYILYGINNTEYYIEKDTGLVIKTIIDNTTAIREYEFDNVDDNVFIEPDVSQYTLIED